MALAVSSGSGRQARGQGPDLTQPVLPPAGHAHSGNPSDYVTYAGLTLKKPSTGEYVISKAVGGTMW